MSEAAPQDRLQPYLFDRLTTSDARSQWRRDLWDRNPAAARADRLLRNALQDGQLKRPEACSGCGAQASLDAFHDDYEKPLLVRWLCSRCSPVPPGWDRDRLHAAIRRDLIWLLNAKAHPPKSRIGGNEVLSRSVLNYGMPDLAGRVGATLRPAALEQMVRRAILQYEPRITPQTLKVRAAVDPRDSTAMTYVLEIEAEVFALPEPEWVRVLASLDSQTGACAARRSAPDAAALEPEVRP